MAANHAQTMQHLYHVAEAASEDLRAFVACFTADGGACVTAAHNLSTSLTAWANACGASCGRLCPMPPVITRCA